MPELSEPELRPAKLAALIASAVGASMLAWAHDKPKPRWASAAPHLHRALGFVPSLSSQAAAQALFDAEVALSLGDAISAHARLEDAMDAEQGCIAHAALAYLRESTEPLASASAAAWRCAGQALLQGGARAAALSERAR